MANIFEHVYQFIIQDERYKDNDDLKKIRNLMKISDPKQLPDTFALKDVAKTEAQIKKCIDYRKRFQEKQAAYAEAQAQAKLAAQAQAQAQAQGNGQTPQQAQAQVLQTAPGQTQGRGQQPQSQVPHQTQGQLPQQMQTMEQRGQQVMPQTAVQQASSEQNTSRAEIQRWKQAARLPQTTQQAALASSMVQGAQQIQTRQGPEQQLVNQQGLQGQPSAVQSTGQQMMQQALARGTKEAPR